MNLTELINECIWIKPGNKEFALFFDGESEWTAEIGNECQNIGLGEAPAEFSESGCSPEEAVSNLLEALRGVAEAADAIAASAAGGGMNDIDWSKAPEGATHYSPTADSEVKWYRRCADGWLFWLPKSHKWDWSGNNPEFFAQLIERPSADWTGSGLPPVGTVCEYQVGDGPWFRCTMIHVLRHIPGDRPSCVINCPHLRGDQIVSLDGWIGGVQFRPIRTPEQIAAEEREKAIDDIAEIISSLWSSEREAAEFLYKAGYRKTEAP